MYLLCSTVILRFVTYSFSMDKKFTKRFPQTEEKEEGWRDKLEEFKKDKLIIKLSEKFPQEITNIKNLINSIGTIDDPAKFEQSFHVLMQNAKIKTRSHLSDKADRFAEEMGQHLQKVREEGIFTQKGIADRFNELGIKSSRNSNWHQNSIKELIHRRRALGLE